MSDEDLEAEREMDEEAIIAGVRARDVAAGLPACTHCGCTESAGCQDPPCWWVPGPVNICSNCLDKETAEASA